jgi:hypothetical protein
MPKGKPLVTLNDAAAYIVALPKNVSDTEPWQIAMEQLIDAAEGQNFLMHARIGMMRDRRLRWRDNSAGPLPSWQSSALSTSPPGGPCQRS